MSWLSRLAFWRRSPQAPEAPARADGSVSAATNPEGNTSGPTDGQPRGADKRRWPRIDLEAQARLTFDKMGPEVRSRITNASARGLFIAMAQPKPIGTRMKITVVLQEPATEIALEGVVVHTVDRAGAGGPLGVGIVLTEAGADWHAFCESLLAQPRKVRRPQRRERP